MEGKERAPKLLFNQGPSEPWYAIASERTSVAVYPQRHSAGQQCRCRHLCSPKSSDDDSTEADGIMFMVK